VRSRRARGRSLALLGFGVLLIACGARGTPQAVNSGARFATASRRQIRPPDVQGRAGRNLPPDAVARASRQPRSHCRSLVDVNVRIAHPRVAPVVLLVALIAPRHVALAPRHGANLADLALVESRADAALEGRKNP
jgi:hypothetical protein